MYSLFHLHDVIGRNQIFNSCVFHVKFKNSCAVFSTIFSDTPMKQHLASAKPFIDDKSVKFLQKFSCFGIFRDATTSIGFFYFCRRGIQCWYMFSAFHKGLQEAQSCLQMFLPAWYPLSAPDSTHCLAPTRGGRVHLSRCSVQRYQKNSIHLKNLSIQWSISEDHLGFLLAHL